MATKPELTFNLIYHVGPIGESYKWNIDQLLKRIHIFRGQKIVAVAQGYGFDDFEIVKSLFPKDVVILPFENNPIIRETATFKPLLNQLTANTNEATFYGHTKGITRGKSEAVKLWTEALYKYNLDNVPAVQAMLKKFPVAGCYKRYGKFPKMPQNSVAHYSGTFFWFRNQALFSKPAWEKIHLSRYGTEAYLGTLFKEGEMGCLFADDIRDPYSVISQRKVLGII